MGGGSGASQHHSGEEREDRRADTHGEQSPFVRLVCRCVPTGDDRVVTTGAELNSLVHRGAAAREFSAPPRQFSAGSATRGVALAPTASEPDRDEDLEDI